MGYKADDEKEMGVDPMEKARRGRRTGSTPSVEWEPIGMTIQELATAMRIDVRTVSNLIKTEGLPARKCGVSWRFDADAVKAWLGSGTYQKTDSEESDD